MKQVPAVLVDRPDRSVVTEPEAMVVTVGVEAVGEQAEAWDLMFSLVEILVLAARQLH
jgi:hypothetical protein